MLDVGARTLTITNTTVSGGSQTLGFGTASNQRVLISFGVVPPSTVNTTVAANAPAQGAATLHPASMAGIVAGLRLEINSGAGSYERAVVTAVNYAAGTFNITLANNQTGPFPFDPRVLSTHPAQTHARSLSMSRMETCPTGNCLPTRVEHRCLRCRALRVFCRISRCRVPRQALDMAYRGHRGR